MLHLACVALAAGAPSADAAKQKADAVLARTAGDSALLAGDLLKAVAHYSKLIELEPTAGNLFKRSTVNLRLRNFADVLKDLTRVLALDPNFVEGYVHRAKVLSLRGECEAARADYERALALKPGHATATAQLPLMSRCAENVALALRFWEQHEWDRAVHHADLALETASESSRLLLLKSRAFLQRNDYAGVLAETRKILQSDKANLDALLLRGSAYYSMGEFDVALSHFREGLKNDPENKPLKLQFKKVKAFLKARTGASDALAARDWRGALEQLADALAVDAALPAGTRALLLLDACRAHVQLKQAAAAVTACSQALDLDNSLFDAWLQRGEARMVAREFQEAINDFQHALQMSQGNPQAQEAMRRAQLELKKSKRKDYYKVLGVAPDSDEKAIKKAFKRLALQHHPDKQAEGEARETAEKAFREMGEAYEVLSDPEKRRKYDAGEDIEVDPNQNFRQHFAQFFQGGGPFGGFPGGGQQQFHFSFG